MNMIRWKLAIVCMGLLATLPISVFAGDQEEGPKNNGPEDANDATIVFTGRVQNVLYFLPDPDHPDQKGTPVPPENATPPGQTKFSFLKLPDAVPHDNKTPRIIMWQANDKGIHIDKMQSQWSELQWSVPLLCSVSRRT